MAEKIFNNPNVFTSEDDFIVGGFSTSLKNLNWSQIKGLMESRIRKAITDYVEHEKLNQSGDNLTEKTKHDNAIILLCSIISDMIGLEVTKFDIDSICDQFINSDQYICWQNGIKIKYDKYIQSNKQFIMGIQPQSDYTEIEMATAQKATNSINFLEILEVLSGIYKN
jgi:peroxiredoxin family protein